MTLKALLHTNEIGRICEIRDPGEEFETHPDFYWVDVPDGTTTSDTYNSDGTITKFDITALPGFTEHAYKVARTIGYGSIGDQLDMLYKEITANGVISNTGPWASHISNIKQAIPKNDPQAVHDWNVQYVASMTQGNI